MGMGRVDNRRKASFFDGVNDLFEAVAAIRVEGGDADFVGVIHLSVYAAESSRYVASAVFGPDWRLGQFRREGVERDRGLAVPYSWVFPRLHFLGA